MPPLLAFPPEVINPIFRDGIDDNELEPIAVEVTTRPWSRVQRREI